MPQPHKIARLLRDRIGTLVKVWTDRIFSLAGAVLPLGFGIILTLNWPGQISYDTVVQLADGRSGHYDTWHPPVMAFLLGLADGLEPGVGLYLIFTLFLLLAAWALLLWLGRPRRGAVIILVLIFCTPQLILYQGTIWKDVLFANAGIAAFAALAAAVAWWENRRARLAGLGVAALFFALATLARQNGFVLLPVAGLCLGLIAARAGSPHAGWRYGLGLVLASLVLVGLVNLGLRPRTDGGVGAQSQLRLAQTYDLVGAARLDQGLRFPVLETRMPALANAIRKDGVAIYSPRLVDTLENSTVLTNAIYHAPSGAIFAAWGDMILTHPLLYLKERGPVFRWVTAPPDLLVCHPDVVGVDGPADLMAKLGLTEGIRPHDRFLYNYVARFFPTPILSHLLYGALAILFAALLIRRGTPADLVMAAMLLAALLFAASFFVVSIACDYRYLYFLDLAAMTGMLWWFCPPGLRYGKSAAGLP
jgi:hypothetical protein